MSDEGIKIFDFDVKKWIKIGISLLVGIFIVRMIVFTIFLGTIGSFFTSFNEYFTTEESSIHNKIEASEIDFKKRTEEFDRMFYRPMLSSAETERLLKGNKWGLQGEDFAKNVVAVKNEYEEKLAACDQDRECKYYLKYPTRLDTQVADEYQVKLAQCMKDEACQKLLKK